MLTRVFREFALTIETNYSLETPENIEVDFELAGPGARFCAICIDWLMIALMVLILLLGAIVVEASSSRDITRRLAELGEAQSYVQALFILMFGLIIIGYYIFWEAVMRGQTPGKKAMKLRALRDDATPMTFSNILIRNLLRFIDSLPVCYMVGGTISMFHPAHKRLGDLAAGTIVVKEGERDYRARQDGKAPVSRDTRQAVNMELTAQERQVLNSFMARRSELIPEARRKLAEKLAGPLFDKYGGHFDSAEVYLARLMEGRHHEP